jgi:hypothetical protein
MHFNGRHLAIALIKALLIGGVIAFFADHFGWHHLREAGGQVVRAAF